MENGLNHVNTNNNNLMLGVGSNKRGSQICCKIARESPQNVRVRLPPAPFGVQAYTAKDNV